MKRSCQQNAFTLIELLVVIGLIALLGSLLLVGIGHLITNSKRQQTNLAFQNLQAMYAEYDAVNRHGGINGALAALPCPQDVTVPAVPFTNDRTGYAALMTRGMVSQMKTMPVNAAALGKMGASAYTSINFDVSSGLKLTSAAWVKTVIYNPLNLIYLKIPDPNNPSNSIYYFFICIQTTTTTTDTTDPNFWVPAGSGTTPPGTSGDTTDSNVPLVTDGWGNPIIYVPGGRLGNSPGAAGPPANAMYVYVNGQVTRPVDSPGYRPFFASAGPDGDFGGNTSPAPPTATLRDLSKADDNMYSFEK